jgi:hypothetical protein
MLMTTM